MQRSQLCELLWDVPDDPRVDFRFGPITDDRILRALPEDLDYVFHLSCYHGNQSSIADPLADHENNTRSTLKLYERIKNFKNIKRVVYSPAGCTVAEKTYDDAQATAEDAPVSLWHDSPYQISKIIGEFYSNYYFGRHRLPVVKARFQNVYGPGEVLGAGQWRGTVNTVWRNVTPTFIYKAIKGEADAAAGHVPQIEPEARSLGDGDIAAQAVVASHVTERLLPADLERHAAALGPGLRPAVEHVHVAGAVRDEEAGTGHRPLTVAAHHRDRSLRDRRPHDAAELDVDRAGHVAGEVLAALPDVDHRADECLGADQPKRVETTTCGVPGADAALELTDDRVVGDQERDQRHKEDGEAGQADDHDVERADLSLRQIELRRPDPNQEGPDDEAERRRDERDDAGDKQPVLVDTLIGHR